MSGMHFWCVHSGAATALSGRVACGRTRGIQATRRCELEACGLRPPNAADLAPIFRAAGKCDVRSNDRACSHHVTMSAANANRSINRFAQSRSKRPLGAHERYLENAGNADSVCCVTKMVTGGQWQGMALASHFMVGDEFHDLLAGDQLKC